GSSQRYHHEIVGLNGRLDEIQAAILRAKLPYLDDWNAQRQAHAAHYAELLSDLDQVVLPEVAGYAEHVFHLYAVQAPRRDELKAHLQERGIGTGIHYPVPCHLQVAFRHLGYKQGDLPVTEQVASQILSLPMYAELTSEQRMYVVEAIGEFYDLIYPALPNG
ncbi:MAG: DegT/DnrJ/EryC1/StrS family aminotransferase, partial [Chloroflexi bacterium]|nr:DegT/DnrJ/EryC1/StrS family aminotransferase [Chloroflexota bacterium]